LTNKPKHGIIPISKEKGRYPNMRTKTYYMSNNAVDSGVLSAVLNQFPSFIKKELIELNFYKVEVTARNEDWGAINEKLVTVSLQ
jgi:hypothetical protein